MVRMPSMTCLALVAIMLAACSGDSGGPVADAAIADAPELVDGDLADADRTDADLTDADLTDADPSDADVAPDASGLTHGAVTISETTDTVGMNSGGVAVFKDEPLFGYPLASAGGCDLHYTPTGSVMSAGTVSVSGTSVPVTFTPSGAPPDVTYTRTPDPTPDDLYTPGDTITATAPVADFPAFTISATAPGALSGFTPGTSFSRSTPIPLSWTAGSGDTMIVQFVTFDSSFTNNRYLVCMTPDDGSFTI